MLKNFFSRHNIYLTGLLIALLFIGLITLYSATKNTTSDNELLFTKQLIFVLSGFGLYLFTSFFPLKSLRLMRTQITIYSGLIIALIAVILFTAKVKGAARWFVVQLPFVGSLNIQPADLAKLVVILVGVFILTQWKNLSSKYVVRNSWLKHKTFPYLLLMIPVLFLVLIQPALGTTIIITVLIILMYYFAEDKKRRILNYLLLAGLVIVIWFLFRNSAIYIRFLISMVILVLFLLSKQVNKVFSIMIFALTIVFLFIVSTTNVINYFGEYQKDRIECWLSVDNLSFEDKQGRCFQQIQAKVAIGSGELFGRGFSQGLQVQQNRLPEFQNDFIYAAFAEQFGFIGTLVLLSVYVLFIIEIFRVSTKKASEYSRIVILAIGMLFLLQLFINIAMNNGLLPTTGISLPFMSYGGSFMWISLVAVGLVQNLSHNEILPQELPRNYSKWDEDSTEY